MSKNLNRALILSFFVLAGCGQDEAEKALTVQPESALSLAENGASGDYVLKLSARPGAPVTVRLTAEPGGVIFSETSVVVRPDDWRLGKSVRVSCMNDVIAQDRAVTVIFATSSSDLEYDGLTVTRALVCLDDDAGKTPGGGDTQDGGDTRDEEPPPVPSGVKFVGAENLVTTEDGGTASFAVVLTKKPAGDVLVTVKSWDLTEGTAAPATMTFSPSNWNVAQSVTITGVDDGEIDGDVDYEVTLTLTSDDLSYDRLDDIVIPVTNLDNDSPVQYPPGTPGVTVLPVAGLKTTESGGTARIGVLLDAEPVADVRIPVVSSDETEGKTDVSELIFTRANWRLGQAVTVTGQDDLEFDGDVSYMINLGPVASADPRYHGLMVTGVRVTNIDNEPLDVPVSIILNRHELQIEESGAPGEIRMTLGAEPAADVRIAVSVSDATEGVVTPALVTFGEDDWNTPKAVMVGGVADGIEDGTQTFEVRFDVTSEDPRYDGYSIPPVVVTSKDSDAHTGETVKLRIMAANISSGNYQSYSPGHGVRIFQAVMPDIVLIQEFNWLRTNESDAVAQTLVTTAFGEDYTYYRGRGAIPNGVISRYPILSSGAWVSNVIENRDWDWAVVDLPGPKELLLVSVHLSTDENVQEMPVLMERIEAKIAAGAKLGQKYFVMIGGDFNTSSRTPVVDNMSSVFTTSEPYPADQNGNTYTNIRRAKPYDYLLCSPDWCKYEVPVEIGTHTGSNGYPHGHVFDSRVYYKTAAGSGTELDHVSPVLRGDSGASGMQHMAVIRDFRYSY